MGKAQKKKYVSLIECKYNKPQIHFFFSVNRMDIIIKEHIHTYFLSDYVCVCVCICDILCCVCEKYICLRGWVVGLGVHFLLVRYTTKDTFQKCF